MRSDTMKMNRRRLLRNAGMAGMSGACGLLASASRAACGPTGSATEGPFYVGYAPEGVDINPGRAPGPTMRIVGTVYSEDGATPLRRARVEIWHADAAGDYHPSGNGDISRYRRGDVNLRGVTHTDDNGRFAFTSVVPGHYGDRRRHIHWKVSAPGHRALTTQSYWLDERGTEREKRDGTDRRVEACRWVSFRDEAGQSSGVFDIVLKTSA
jgi:protocatechuate 3,4-dioxygenase beta subunit